MKQHPDNTNILLMVHSETVANHAHGYPLVHYTEDFDVICDQCIGDNITDCTDPKNKEWFITSNHIYWEGPPLQCDQCTNQIESSYGDPEDN